MIEWFKKYRQYRKTMNEIDKLSDREVEDIGRSRAEIEQKVYKHCFNS